MSTSKTNNPRYQCECPHCLSDIWIPFHADPHIICPHCGARLPEQSSEDADDGTYKGGNDVN